MLTERDLTHFKKKLTRLKHEMLEVIDANKPLSFEDYGELASYDSHFADTATQLEEREVQFSIKDSAQHILNEVNQALDRIRSGTYGKCVDTGKDIPYDRLEVLPYAKRTVNAQEKLDELADSVPQTELSFSTPIDDQRGDDRLQTVDELQHEHGNSSYRTK